MAYAAVAAWYVQDNSTNTASPTNGSTPGTVGWSAVTPWPASTSVSPGKVVRQSGAGATITATIATTTMTISATLSGTVTLGQSIAGTGISGTPTITAFGTYNGSTGTVTISATQTVSSGETITCAFVQGNERVFVFAPLSTATGAQTTGATEPLWIITKGGYTTDNTNVHWIECTGQPAINGDLTNASIWTASSAPGQGHVIYDPTSASLQICNNGGTSGSSKPTFSATAGTTTSDSSAIWTSLGAASNFGAWGAPFARCAQSIAAGWGVAGTTIFVADNHAEVSSANIILAIGTQPLPIYFICVDHTTSVPPGSGNLLTTASLSTTATASILINNSTGDNLYFNGITFSAGTGSSIASLKVGSNGTSTTVFDNCSLALGNTSTSSLLELNANISSTSEVFLRNTTLSFGSTGQVAQINSSNFVWRNTPSAIGGSIFPTTLFNGSPSGGSTALIEGVDLSALTGTIIGTTQTGLRALFANCKLNSSVTLAATPLARGVIIDAIQSGSSGVTYNQQRVSYEGMLIPETTIIRTGGASDGTTGISWNISTTANVVWVNPFECFPISEWNDTVGSSVTVSLHGIVNSAAVPANDFIWFDLLVMGSGSSPLGTIISGSKANILASDALWAADSTSAWDSQGPVRANSTSYSVGSSFTVSSNVGRRFWVISGSGNTASSLPSGYATAIDGGTVADGGYSVRAGCRFTMSVTASSPQPAIAGYVRAYVKAAFPSGQWYIDPKIDPALT